MRPGSVNALRSSNRLALGGSKLATPVVDLAVLQPSCVQRVRSASFVSPQRVSDATQFETSAKGLRGAGSSQVNHRRRQFTAAKGKHVAGTQCIDRTWAHLKRWSHRQGKNCKSVSTQRASAHFWTDAFAWCFVHKIRCMNRS